MHAGVDLAVAALRAMANTPPSSTLQPGIQTAAATLRKMAQDPNGAAQVRKHVRVACMRAGARMCAWHG